MNKYVALLRGINVGGNSKISMRALIDIFESLGFSKVETYINSGDVVFATNKNRSAIHERIETVLEKELNIPIKVILRSRQEIEETISDFPYIFSDPNWKHNVIFLGESIDNPEILKKFEIRPEIEVNSYHRGVIFWSAELSSGTRSIMYKLSRDPSYREMTVRSVGTVRKICELLNT